MKFDFGCHLAGNIPDDYSFQIARPFFIYIYPQKHFFFDVYLMGETIRLRVGLVLHFQDGPRSGLLSACPRSRNVILREEDARSAWMVQLRWEGPSTRNGKVDRVIPTIAKFQQLKQFYVSPDFMYGFLHTSLVVHKFPQDKLKFLWEGGLSSSTSWICHQAVCVKVKTCKSQESCYYHKMVQIND